MTSENAWKEAFGGLEKSERIKEEDIGSFGCFAKGYPVVRTGGLPRSFGQLPGAVGTLHLRKGIDPGLWIFQAGQREPREVEWYAQAADFVSHLTDITSGDFYEDVRRRLREKPALLDDVIEKSKWLLELKDGWDDGRKAITRETWDAAIAFLKQTQEWIYDSAEMLPRLGPGPDGGIDLHWKNDKMEVLVGIPPSPATLAPFYGDNKLGEKAEGQVSVHSKYFGMFLLMVNGGL